MTSQCNPRQLYDKEDQLLDPSQVSSTKADWIGDPEKADLLWHLQECSLYKLEKRT